MLLFRAWSSGYFLTFMTKKIAEKEKYKKGREKTNEHKWKTEKRGTKACKNEENVGRTSN